MTLLFDTTDFFTNYGDQQTSIAAWSNAKYRVPELNIISTNRVIDKNHIETSKQKFERLSSQWKKETINSSSLSDITSNSHYQEIIKIGDAAVPFILEDLIAGPSLWFTALTEITGKDPVKKRSQGRIRKMAEDWIQWGRGVGYAFDV